MKLYPVPITAEQPANDDFSVVEELPCSNCGELLRDHVRNKCPFSPAFFEPPRCGVCHARVAPDYCITLQDLRLHVYHPNCYNVRYGVQWDQLSRQKVFITQLDVNDAIVRAHPSPDEGAYR